MWLLQHLSGEKVFYIDVSKEEFTLGRKESCFIITGDKSISRKHAIFFHKKNEDLFMEDCGAKYHTYLNGQELKPKNPIKLNKNDVIKFGQFQSIYKVVYMQDFKVLCTGMSANEINELRNKLKVLNGKIYDTWNKDITHLSVKNPLKISVKSCCAIVNGQHIVKSIYWDDVLSALKNNIKLPDPLDYEPTAYSNSQGSNLDLAFNPARKELFRGKIFMFETEKYKAAMNSLIACTGGISTSWDKKPLQKKDLEKENLIFVQNSNEPSQKIDSFHKMIEYLSTKNFRPVTHSEIAMAVIMCSCENFCNPKVNPFKNLVSIENTQESQPMKSSLVLAPDTLPERLELPKINKLANKSPVKLNVDFFAETQEFTEVKLESTQVEQNNPKDNFKVPQNFVTSTQNQNNELLTSVIDLSAIASTSNITQEHEINNTENLNNYIAAGESLLNKSKENTVSPKREMFEEKKDISQNIVIPETLETNFAVPLPKVCKKRQADVMEIDEPDADATSQKRKKTFLDSFLSKTEKDKRQAKPQQTSLSAFLEEKSNSASDEDCVLESVRGVKRKARDSVNQEISAKKSNKDSNENAISPKKEQPSIRVTHESSPSNNTLYKSCWLSKSIKNENIPAKKISQENYDEEMAAFEKQFMDCVQITFFELPKKNLEKVKEKENRNYNGVKNVKIFKKVPVKSRSTDFDNTNYITIVCGSNLDMNSVFRNFTENNSNIRNVNTSDNSDVDEPCAASSAFLKTFNSSSSSRNKNAKSQIANQGSIRSFCFTDANKTLASKTTTPTANKTISNKKPLYNLDLL